MTAFIIACAAMVAAALLWIVLPLLRQTGAEDPSSRNERRISGAVIALATPVLAVAMYASLSSWDWEATEAVTARSAEMDDMLRKLETKLAENPTDADGWMLLGRSYTALQRYPRAADAFQQAYDLSRGENVEAVIGLGEALALTDEASLNGNGRAGQLFEAALAKAPNHPKALWYGSIAAIQSGDLRRGRDRLRLLMAQNPPAELRSVLERQIQDLDQQLNEAGVATATPATAGTEGPAAAGRTIRVAVSIAPEIQKQLAGPVSLFILARDPAAGGPPLAVQRHSSQDLPLTVELSERDAMIAARTIASVPRVQVVARLSRSGTPQARSGDFYGQAEHDFDAENANKGSGRGATLNIIIDRTVP